MGTVGVRTSGLTADTLLAEARRVSTQVAARHADDVDATGRFPVESIEAMREAGLLGAMVPLSYGGAGIGPATMARAIEIIGESCATSGMILAMHQIQVACLIEYSSTAWLEAFLAGPVADGALLASATSELGIGGDIRRSRCALSGTGGVLSLVKEASVISYGEYSDAILATARRDDAAPSHDQVLVVVPVAGGTLERVSEWNSLGFRGTCSHGYVLRAEVSHEQIVGDAFVTVLGRTMLPTSHVFWASLWTGMATGALKTARSYLKAQARAKGDGDTPMGAERLQEVGALLGGGVGHDTSMAPVPVSVSWILRRARGPQRGRGRWWLQRAARRWTRWERVRRRGCLVVMAVVLKKKYLATSTLAR